MYFINIQDGFVESVSTGTGQAEITQSEYDSLLGIIQSAPSAPDGFLYKLRADTREWELVELPPMPDPEPDPEPSVEDKAEAYDILMGGAP